MGNHRLVHQCRADRLVKCLLHFREKGVKPFHDYLFNAITRDAEKLADGIRAENEREDKRLVDRGATGDMMECGEFDPDNLGNPKYRANLEIQKEK